MRKFLTLLSITSKQVSKSQQYNNLIRQKATGLANFAGFNSNLLSLQTQPRACFSLSTTNYLFGKKSSNSNSKSGAGNSSSDSVGKKKSATETIKQAINNKKVQFENQTGHCSTLSEKSKSKFNSGKQSKSTYPTSNESRGRVNKSKSGDNSSYCDNNNDYNKTTNKKMSTTNNSVKHNKSKHQFTMDLGNNQVARIEYRPIGKGKIEMYHTEVPNELRNRGIGKALAKGSLEQAKIDNLKVKLTCTYLINYLNNFSEQKFDDIVEK